jgi:hypothetical protein
MGVMFDPYHKWLGIPPADQPPNHYRLLGLVLFESDVEVIDVAAEQRVSYLRICASGEHVGLSQKLLNEVAAVRLCLLNATKKAEYDRRLRQSLAQTRDIASGDNTVEESGVPDFNSTASPSKPDRRDERGWMSVVTPARMVRH